MHKTTDLDTLPSREKMRPRKCRKMRLKENRQHRKAAR